MLGVVVIGIVIGSSNINILDVCAIIGNKVFGIPLYRHIKANEVAIIWNLRLPRVLLAFIVGGALAASGAVVQSVLKNALASPYTLGVSAGASLAAGTIMILGISLPLLGNLTLPFVGFIAGVLTVFGVIGFASKIDKNLSNHTVVLAGMIFSLFVNALFTIIIALSRNSLERITFWQLGSFSLRGWSYVQAAIIFSTIGIFGVMRYTKELDILTFGENEAKAIGVETEKVKKHLLILSALLTGSAVALSGTIGFVDLVAPHFVRKIFGSNHKYVIPASVVFGGVLMVIADLIARTIIAPSELPVGAITALIGAPFFAYIYFRKTK